ncbi:unnamed protein product [Dovyalis caffra]|uniref:Uncharacterized protein n=1 Tax=Dovyalis caffra TaxID=77055 RepID=A0AAV1QQK4_9ROSI|nr:unnamed protein product [Dovyalis caffra]
MALILLEISAQVKKDLQLLGQPMVSSHITGLRLQAERIVAIKRLQEVCRSRGRAGQLREKRIV